VNDTLTVSLVASNQCGTDSDVQQIIIGCYNTTSSVQEVVTANWVVYPNPTTGLLNIRGLNAVGGFDALVLDVAGRVVLRERFESAAEVQQLDLSQEPNGIYLLRISTENHVQNIKLVLEH
jgi:hypothetical protein